MSEKKTRVGFVSYWFERGQAFITKNVIQAVEDDCEVFVFARSDGVNTIGKRGEWNIPNVYRFGHYQIPQAVLKRWILDNDIDLVFFNEEYDFELVGMVKRMGVATMGVYYWELFNPEYTPYCNMVYDAVICPTAACFKRFGELGVKNIHHVKWGIDLDVFKPIAERSPGPIRFFHPAGWGGMHSRRGTQFVIDAFKQLGSTDAELLIHTQYDHEYEEIKGISYLRGTVSHDTIRQLSQDSDVAILPSKWEGLGLTFLESLACGLPIITVDAPPMNEFVKHGVTGYCCDVDGIETYSDIFVTPAIVDVETLAERIDMLADPSLSALLKSMQENTIAMRSEWDWKVNSLPLRDLILELGENAVEKKGKTGKSAELDTITALIQGTPPDADTRQYARFHKIMADPMLKGRVLDVGCKHGTLAFMLGEKFNYKYSDQRKSEGPLVTGIDSDAKYIEICKKARESNGWWPDAIEFQHAEIKSLPFDDASFDTVILAQVIEHVENPEDLKELMRVLKPDGCLIITTPVGFAHWDPDHKWFFLPDATYEMLRGGWFFMESNNAPAFMKYGNVVPFGKFVEKYLGEAYGYQVYNNHESQFHSLEIYARVYKPEAALIPFPEIEGDQVIEEVLLSTSTLRPQIGAQI